MHGQNHIKLITENYYLHEAIYFFLSLLKPLKIARYFKILEDLFLTK